MTPRRTRQSARRARNLATLAGLALAAPVLAQSASRAAFVANNGNIEGSITSYTFSASGEPQFVQKFVTGSGSGNPGNNCYGLSLSPNGQFLATTHATAASVTERITLLRVNADATLGLIGVFNTPDSPLACVWINDQYLAVTQTKSTGNNLVIMYRFDPAGPSLVEVDREFTESFTSYLAATPDGQYLYAPAGGLSGPTEITTFRVNPDGTLAVMGVMPTGGTYCLGPGVTNDGLRLYGGGGISSGSTAIVAFNISPVDGTLEPMPGSPFQTPVPPNSPSPKQCVSSSDDRFLFVGHGSSSMVRSLAVGLHGELTDTGFAYDVGIQGDLGGIAVLGDLLLFTRKYSGSAGPTGLLSWTVQPDGSFTPNGTVVSSQGSLPQYVVGWAPLGAACYANCDGSIAEPVLNIADLACFLNRFASGDPYANCDGSTETPVLNVADFGCFLVKFAGGCG